MKAKIKKIFIILLLFLTLGLIISINAVSTKAENELDTYYIKGSNKSSCCYGESAYTGTEKGLIGHLESKDSLVLRKTIDISKYKTTPFITIVPLPTNKGVADYGEIDVKVIDAFDDTNYITIKVNPYQGHLNDYDIAYVLASASNGQKPSAIDRGGSTIFVNQWGSWTYFTFNQSCNTGLNNNVSFCFDSEELIAYTYEQITSRYFVIADFDNNDFYGEKLWNGFSSNYVYVEVSLGDYQSQAGEFMVYSYGDCDLSNEKMLDEEGPIISVDYNGFESSQLPIAVVGHKYHVYNATAKDVYSSDNTLNTKVYYNYYSSSKMSISLDKNGYFTPSISGIYTICYTAKDEFNNVTIKTIDIEAKNESDIEPFSVSVSNYEQMINIADEFIIPDYQVNNFIGNYDVNITVTTPTNNYELNGSSLRVYETGTLNVNYSAVDYANQKYSKSITVMVNPATKVTFMESVTLPNYFIDGNTYTLPIPEAKDYTNNSGALVETKVQVIENGLTKTLDSNKYTPSVNNSSDKVTVKYIAGTGEKETTVSYEIEVVKIKNDKVLDMAKLFKSTNGVATSASSAINLTQTGLASYEYLNAIYSNTFNTKFKASSKSNNIETLTFKLTDYYNENNTISFTYENTPSGLVFYYNNDKTFTYKLNYLLNNGTPFYLEYDNQNNNVKYDINSSKTLTISTNELGDEFNGFVNNKFYVTLIIESENESDIDIESYNGNYFSNSKREYIGPTISFMDDYGGEGTINSIVTLPRAFTFDLVSGDTDCYLSVYGPDEEPIKDLNGVLLEDLLLDNTLRQIKLTTYGKYQFIYFSKDDYGNKLSYEYSVRVVDTEQPKIELKNAIKEEVNVGEKVYIPEAVVKDNIDTDLTYTVKIILPDNTFKTLKNGSIGFIPKSKGTYRIIYYVSDTEGNLTVKVYNVNVK